MRRKGFTLVELLVVIAIIALLMGILMPALARVRQLAFRMTCGTNLSGIGKAMLVYAHDNDDELPKAGTRQAAYGVPVWDAQTAVQAYAISGTNSVGNIASSFYLLVKYAEMTPKSFVCKSDTGTTEWDITGDVTAGRGGWVGMQLTEAWNFGSQASEHCSYAYHTPYAPAGAMPYALTTSSDPGLAVAADRNPWLPSPMNPDVATQAATNWSMFNPNGAQDEVRPGNCYQHQQDGQNVMFLDTHVEFPKTSACSLEEDNIYTKSSAPNRGDPYGVSYPTSAAIGPTNRRDNLMLHDTAAAKGRSCFPGNTIVWMDGEMESIADVSAGQSVGLTSSTEVEELEVHDGTHAIVHDVVLETGECITVIDSHLFKLASGQFVNVQQLRQGSELTTMDGTVKVSWVAKRTSPFVGNVYNVKVQDADEYFVGKTGVCVRDF